MTFFKPVNMNGLLIVGLVKSFKSHAYGLPVMSLNSRNSDRPTVKELGSSERQNR